MLALLDERIGRPGIFIGTIGFESKDGNSSPNQKAGIQNSLKNWTDLIDGIWLDQRQSSAYYTVLGSDKTYLDSVEACQSSYISTR